MELRTLIIILVVACAALVLMKVREHFAQYQSYDNPLGGYLVNKYGLGIFGIGAKPSTPSTASGGDWGSDDKGETNINFANKPADDYIAEYLARRDAATTLGTQQQQPQKDLSSYRALSPQLTALYDKGAIMPDADIPAPTAAVGADSKTYPTPLTPEAIKSAYTSLRPQIQADIQDAVKNEMLVSRATKAAAAAPTAASAAPANADSDGLYQGAEFNAAKKRRPAAPCSDPNPNCPCSKRGCGGGQYCPCAGSGAGRCSGGGASAGGNGATPCNVPQDSTSCAPFDSSKYIRKDSIPCWKCNLA
jgi:hypothetical protein